MRITLAYPSWERLSEQTRFVLPPLGPAVVAALTPPGHEVSIVDENVEPVDAALPADLVGVSAMLACQLPRAFAIADAFRSRGVPVVLGGLAATTLAAECAGHADALVLGEAEGVWPEVVRDAAAGSLKPSYRRKGFAAGAEIPPALRGALRAELYAYRGLRMMDLVETSRGCRHGCFPCQVPGFSGAAPRFRDMDAVLRELESIPNERVFVVDNSPGQDPAHELALFDALRRARKRWVSHPISTTPERARLAAEAGCWYVYQAVYGAAEPFRDRVRTLHDHGIGVEATVLFGLDDQGPEVFRRAVDLLLEAGTDIAEFTVLTPFPGTKFFDDVSAAGRLLHRDWGRYNAEHAVFKPARMTPEELEQGCRWAWREFYRDEPQRGRMARLLRLGGVS